MQTSVLLLTGHSTGKKMYKALKPLVAGSRSSMDYITEMPCGVCPVVSQCTEGGIISPSTCVYYTQWLAAVDDDSNANGDILSW